LARKPSRRVVVPSVVLSETLDLPAAIPLAAELLGRRGQDVAIDASASQRLGAQCLQVLLAARATWAEDKHSFRIISASSEFAAACTLLGAADLAVNQDA
jgi:chemotaxis protein CheX